MPRKKVCTIFSSSQPSKSSTLEDAIVLNGVIRLNEPAYTSQVNLLSGGIKGLQLLQGGTEFGGGLDISAPYMMVSKLTIVNRAWLQISESIT